MSPSYTAAQRAAILRDGHTLIEAGAGSGKTTTLVGKVLHALGARVFPDAEPVAEPCTLGEIAAITFTTAAAADLKRALRRRLREHAAATGDRRWQRVVYEVDRARIGTIHGFCAAMLREFGIRVGIDPGFRVLDEGDALALREELVRARVYRALRERDPAATELVFHLGPERCVRLVGEAVDRGDASREAFERWCTRDGAPRLTEIQEALAAHGGRWREEVDGDAVRLGSTLLRLAVEAREEIDRRLDAESAMDYDALIYRTRWLLENRADVLAAVRARLRWLFIDEFQDTDPAQRDIADFICGLRRPEDAMRGPVPSLCIVGDPKQSIYGFRRADVTLWKRVERTLRSSGAEPIALDTSFRSRRPLVSYVNGTFAWVMAPAAGDGIPRDFEVAFRPLHASRDYQGDDETVEVLALPAGLNAPERRAEEAERIARRIRAMVDGQEPVAWNGGRERAPVRWKDIALLFRSTGDVWMYEEALRRHAIPCYRPSGDGFFATREVRDVMLLLRALCDSHDDVAWFGLLRSPLVGVSDEGIMRLRVRGARVPLSAAIEGDLPGDDGIALAAARSWIAELRMLRDRIPAAALIDRAVERSGYAAVLLYNDEGDVSLANLRKLVRMADGHPEASLAELVRHLEDRTKLAKREGEAPLHTAGEDVVTLTTVHGAKGLEWPVVFLCDLDREARAGKEPSEFLCDLDVGVSLKVELELEREGSKGTIVAGSWDALQRLAAEREVAEEKRVWYVAATRARDRVVLCAVPEEARATVTASEGDAHDPGTGEGMTRKARLTPSRWLLGGAALGAERVEYEGDGARYGGPVCAAAEGELVAVEPAAPPDAESIVAGAERDAAIALRIRPVTTAGPLFRRSATELMLYTRSPDDHRRAYHLGLRPSEFSRASTSSGAARLDARTAGDIVHLALEMHAVDADLDALLEREVGTRLGEEGTATVAGTVARLRATVERARAHPTVERMLAAGAEHELAFTWLVRTTAGPSVVHGAMDLVAQLEGAFEILDFKTHAITSRDEARQAAAGYALQRDLYAAALADLLGTPSAFGFLFTALNEEVRHALEMNGIAAERERLVALLAKAQGMQ